MTSAENSALSSIDVNTFEVVVARLTRLRRGKEGWSPSSIVVELSGSDGNGEYSVFGQSDLSEGRSHVLLPAIVWESAESLLGRLAGARFDLSRPGDAHAYLQRLIAEVAGEYGNRFRQQDQQVYTLVTAAFRDAIVALYTPGHVGNALVAGGLVSATTANTAEFYETYHEKISKYAVAPIPAEPAFNGQPANAFDDAPFIEPLPKDGTKGFLLEREALRYGMSTTRFPNGAFVVADSKGQRLGFKWGRSPLASGVALSICSYKEATRRLLERVDVPVPQGRVFSMLDRENAIAYADRIGYPVVCKPVAGLRGIGVVAGIQSQEELIEALNLYAQSEMGTDDFVIEEHCPGDDYRIVVIGDEVVASVVRAPASVVGDGIHTVADLIEYKNRARLLNPHLSSRLIKMGSSLEYQLSLAGLTYASIPAVGQHVTLANSANLSQGGDSFEIADQIHPSIKDLAVKAVQAIPGLGFCGLDMLIEDHTKPVSEQRVTVIELNAHAAIGSAQYPMWGTPAPVARRFFEATAEAAGIELPEAPQDTLSLRVVVRGTVTKVGYRRWMQKHARSFGVTGYAKNVDDRQVEMLLQGSADAVSALVYLALEGSEKSVPTSVTAVPCPPEERQRFVIKR